MAQWSGQAQKIHTRFSSLKDAYDRFCRSRPGSRNDLYFFLLSIITSSAVEVVLTVTKLSAKILAKWQRFIFNLPALLPDGTLKLHQLHGKPVILGQSIRRT